MGLEFSVEVKDPQKRNLDLRQVIPEFSHLKLATKWTGEGTTYISGSAVQQKAIKSKVLKLGMVWDFEGKKKEEIETKEAKEMLTQIISTEEGRKLVENTVKEFQSASGSRG
jgi:TPP-dependent indolepyruvate ferredoxin oxidoreductase alpha subunit